MLATKPAAHEIGQGLQVGGLDGRHFRLPLRLAIFRRVSFAGEKVAVEFVVQPTEKAVGFLAIGQDRTQPGMFLLQVPIFVQPRQETRVECRPAVRIFAVEKELTKHDPRQQIVDAVVVEAFLLQPLANVLQPLK